MFEVDLADHLAAFDGGVSVGISSLWLNFIQFFDYLFVEGVVETQGIVFLLLFFADGGSCSALLFLTQLQLHFNIIEKRYLNYTNLVIIFLSNYIRLGFI